jgi:diguanylate cyclase (GGDEF)-like protein/PAS domain S-box-containing protein
MSIIDSLTVPTFVVGVDHTVLAWNRACEKLTGVLAKDIVGSKESWRGFYDEPRPCLVDLLIDDAEVTVRDWYTVHGKSKFSGGYHAEGWFPHLNGEKRYLIFDAEPVFDEQGKLIGGVENLEDITEIKTVEDRLMLSDKVFTYTNQSILITDAKQRIVQVNQAFTRLTGYEPDEVRGQTPAVLKSGRHGAEFYQKMEQELAKTAHWEGEIWDRRKDGTIYPKWLSINAVRDEQSDRVTHYIAIFSDITERKEAEERVKHIAFHDALTQLPNRMLFQDRLEQAITDAKRKKKLVALMFIDLDRFKLVNDTLGHHIGDLLLQEIAGRLTRSVRASDTVARLGGDEFVIILPEVARATDVSKVAAKILTSLNEQIIIDGNELFTTPSIGISLYPVDAEDTEGLMKAADTAMYHVKEHGKNSYQYFTYAMTEFALERAELEHELRAALDKNQFELHYQPKIDLALQRVTGCEALLRWKNDQGTYIPPDKFIPIAEETGSILEIGQWVLQQAARDMAVWRTQGLTDISIAINLSPVQFKDPELFSKVKECAELANLNADMLELEITENILMKSVQDSSGVLINLKQTGVSLAIDDFGTGYSSLSYLKSFSIDTLKIDRSFINDIHTDTDSAAIVSAVVALAHNMGLKVVAEGVETQEQSDFLAEISCDLCQGYFFSKPVPADLFFNYVVHNQLSIQN